MPETPGGHALGHCFSCTSNTWPPRRRRRRRAAPALVQESWLGQSCRGNEAPQARTWSCPAAAAPLTVFLRRCDFFCPGFLRAARRSSRCIEEYAYGVRTPETCRPHTLTQKLVVENPGLAACKTLASAPSTGTTTTTTGGYCSKNTQTVNLPTPALVVRRVVVPWPRASMRTWSHGTPEPSVLNQTGRSPFWATSDS